MSGNNENEEGTKDLTAEEELRSRSESSVSSVISRTSSPEQTHQGILTQEVQDVGEENISDIAVVAARGIINPNKITDPPVQSGIRGMLIASLGRDVNRASNSDPTDPIQEDQEETLEETHDVQEDLEGLTTEEPDTTRPEKNAVLDYDLPSSRPSSASSSSSQEPDELNKNGISFQESAEVKSNFVTVPGTVELVSISTQTEWSWLKDVELYQEILTAKKPEWADRTERKLSKDGSKSPSANSLSSLKRQRKRSVGRRLSGSSDRTQSRDDDNMSLPDVNEGFEPKQNDGLEEGSASSKGRRKSKSGSVRKSRQSVVSSLPHTPKEGDILFRPATVEPDSSSSSEDNEDYDIGIEYMLPSIGPPAILQYMKESQHPPLSNEEVQDREEYAKTEMLKKSMFSGPCMFCKQEVLPFPSVQELEVFSADQLYCCPQYERLVKFELAMRNDKAHLTDEVIDIKPHPPYGTKAARRAAKERAAERAREREMERQRAAGANPTNFYALTRQMKTITYSLASTKCMEEGWTVRPESPTATESEIYQDPFVIEVNPLQLRRQTFLERFYDNKRRFLLLLPDGTGCCYYPSGNIAVLITSTEPGKFTYIAYDNEEDPSEKNSSHMLAIFEPSGHGTCYYRNGKVRLVLNPLSGVLLDNRGARRKRWLWHNLKDHVHAPPFQPITFMMTRHLSIRCLSQSKTVLTFNHGKHTARFNVGAKLKAVTKSRPQTTRDSYETHLAEVKQFVNILVDRAHTAMRLPNYPRLDKIPLPLHLQKVKDAGKKARLQTLSPSNQQETTVIVN